MSIKSKITESPMGASLTIIILAASGVTAIGSLTGAYDSAHTTQLELSESHPIGPNQWDELEKQMQDVGITNKCRWLKSEIRALEDSIYVRKRDGANADFIHVLEQDLGDLQDEYRDLNCIRRLSR